MAAESLKQALNGLDTVWLSGDLKLKENCRMLLSDCRKAIGDYLEHSENRKSETLLLDLLETLAKLKI